MRWLAAGAAVAGLTGAAAVAAVPPKPHATTVVFYSFKVAVKGGTTLTNSAGGLYTGDMVQEAASGSFSIDAKGAAPEAFFVGRLPRSGGRSGAGGGNAIVNGTWTSKGTKWLDAPNEVTGPFACGGKIDTTVKPASMGYSWKRSGSKLAFTLRTVQEELSTLGADSCPNDSRAGGLGSVSPAAYETEFSLPVGELGQKTIVKQISGPLARNRIYVKQYCGGSDAKCAFNLTWHGQVRFTRTRVMQTYLP